MTDVKGMVKRLGRQRLTSSFSNPSNGSFSRLPLSFAWRFSDVISRDTSPVNQQREGGRKGGTKRGREIVEGSKSPRSISAKIRERIVAEMNNRAKASREQVSRVS
ncbi:hypothetical protein E2C01_073852 [Portunus trituberculatus]|uniref:Uncharacterized protein n=1 Tax=Portunus trituberculatus TaxID=210409 RepID=A0A5B7IBR7_PORTR|nr:hypothetical protein [Portunus trituberculatus]